MLPALWACPILSNLTALLHVLRTAQSRQGLPQGCAEGGLWQWYKTRPLFVCTPAQVAQCSFWEMCHSEKEGNCSVLGQVWDLFHCTAGCSWAIAECRSLAQALHTAQTPERGVDPVTPVPGTGIPCYSHAAPPLLLGRAKADLRQENSTSANKVLWPVPSFCSLSFCRFQNSRLLISLNNFHNLLKPKKKEPELKHTPLWE